ncbi:hypothetical protein AB835_11305 [Candidatus Endobugula sertula]|uniref:Thioredoxin domain-containing protein n=1 Tax=Candidatus Endobugula sertula TaxID=62101 RepID=A0A1D2QN35_9GAMM|nr:hypothetical protein AB835_11305 [Candidatus Endobugula sertula]
MTAATKKKGVFIVGSLVLLTLVGIALYMAGNTNSMKAQQEKLFSLGFFYFDPARQLSDIPMVNVKGETKSFVDHLSGWRLVNFGYMYCPDICPVNLSLLSDVKMQWDEEQQKHPLQNLSVVHVTFDPARDTPKLLNEYLTYMNPQFYGLTGELSNIRRLAQQFNIVFIHEKPDEQGNYFISHSDSIALVSPDGEYVGMFKGPYQKDHMIQALKILIN